jgi:hypothetical protein
VAHLPSELELDRRDIAQSLSDRLASGQRDATRANCYFGDKRLPIRET